MTGKVAWVSCLPVPGKHIDVDVDESPAIDALRAAGIDVELVAWDNDAIDWTRFEIAILRSTWNYQWFANEFFAWLKQVNGQTRLVNPYNVLMENLHKGYLLGFAAAGVPIVPTVLIREDDRNSPLPKVTGSSVLKPAIGGGSFGVMPVNSDAELAELVKTTAPDGDLLLQPFMESVKTLGERSLVWIDGQFTHKIIKRPRFEGQHEGVSDPEPLSGEELAFGELVLAQVPTEELLYARVDVMFDEQGGLVLSELELAEPSLFIAKFPAGIDRFVAGVQSQLAASVRH